jgi:hemerythrin
VVLLEWRDDYLLGIRFLDFEHRDLFERINDLFGMCVSHADTEHVADCLGRLHARLSARFALEERVMRERNCDEYEPHKRSHKLLLDELRDIMDEYEDSQNLDEDELSRRFDNWFAEHFSTYDASLHRYLPH